MENFTTDTALVESILWIPGALLYLPLGILSAAILLEIVDLVQKTRENDRAALSVLLFGLITTFFATHLGAAMVFFLGDWGNFPFRRLLPGYLLGLLFLASWFVKYLSRRAWRNAAQMAAGHRQTKQRTSGSPLLNAGYRGLLLVTLAASAACLSYKADFGNVPAYVTLGFHGKAEALPKPPPPPEVAATEPAPETPDPAMVASTTPPPEEKPEPVMEEPPEPVSSEPQPQPMPKMADAPVAPEPEGLTVSFAKDVEPLLERYCYDCHGANKDKGDVRLHTPADIRNGNGDDPVIVPGDPMKSSLYVLTTLSPDDEDVMPSKGDPLTKAEQEILKKWVEEGAYLADNHKADDPPSAEVVSEGEGEDSGIPLSKSVVIPNPDYLANLEKKGIVVTKGAEEHMLEIDYSQGKFNAGGVDLELLNPLARNIVALNLTKVPVSDDDLAPIAEFQNLVSLRLDRTNIGDDTLFTVGELEKLEIVTLFATRVSDNGINRLGGLKNLKEVVAFNTMVTADGANRLRQSLPNAEIQAPE